MKTRTLIVTIVILLVLAVGGGWWWLSQANAVADTSALEATGMIEARTVNLAPELSGKIVEVLVEEGQRVTAGQTLVRLDDSLLVVQHAQAEAALEGAEANLALLKAGATADQLNAAEAQLAQAEAGLQAAQAALDAATAGSRPEEIAAVRANLDRLRANYLNLKVTLTSDQLEQVRSALTTAESNLTQAKARRDDLAKDTRIPAYVIAAAEAAIADAEAAVAAAQAAYTAAQDETQSYSARIELARLSWEVAQTNLSQAEARRTRLAEDNRTPSDALAAADATNTDAQKQVEAAKAAHDTLTTNSSATPLDAAWAEVQRTQSLLAAFAPARATLPVSVKALLVQIDAAQATRDLAAANLSSLKNGARAEQIDAAQAQVEVAQAQLDALDLQVKKLTLVAPWDGVVLGRSAEAGQTALPGGTLLEVGRLDSLELTAYLPEERFGLVTPGQTVSVRVDAYPDRVFAGTVLRVADEAEFTPTNVQTKEDRSRLVYAVVIGLDNPDLALKPGMIVDVEFGR